MKRIIFYDLDGTLVDTREDIARAANHMRQQMGLTALQTSEVSHFVGRGIHHLIQSCLETGDAKQIEKGFKIYRDHYAKHMLDHSRLYPGAKEVLEFFKKRKQAVVTNKPNPFSREMLEALGVAHYFIEIISGNSDYPKKPDPAAILSIMKKENIGCEAALFVGDSLIDIETGRNAGITTAIITHGFGAQNELQSARPDALARDFKEFLDLAKKEGW